MPLNPNSIQKWSKTASNRFFLEKRFFSISPHETHKKGIKIKNQNNRLLFVRFVSTIHKYVRTNQDGNNKYIIIIY